VRHRNSILAVVILACISPVRPLASDFPDLPDFAGNAAQQRTKWPGKTIRISLSTSLGSPSSAVNPGSDVMGAVRRALSRWATVANIRFEEVESNVQSISPVSGGDGISLITIAETPENLSIFGSGHNPARTRVFYDPETGEIYEADIAINPRATAGDGTPLQFSTDGTPGTYDLESTLTHEIGHLLGLEHSSVIGSTMQAHQGVNGTYKLPAFTERTLSEDDRARVLSLYGPSDGVSAIEGKLTNSSLGGYPVPLQGAHVWVEESPSGRVIASALTSASGNYRIENIPPGRYRVLTEYLDGQVATEGSLSGAASNLNRAQRAFRSAEISNRVRVRANSTSKVNFVLVPPQSGPPLLRPRLIGTNGELSTTPLPAEAGKKLTIYVGGEGVDQVPISGISVMSPFMAIDPDSLTLQQFGTSFPVIGFDVTVAAHAYFGDYSIRLQSNSGEVAYVPGGITLDPGVNSLAANPADDAAFFIRQHYRDFLGREPDPGTLAYWVGELGRCGSDLDCVRARRIDVSKAFFEAEFQERWSFIYRLYKAALGRRPTLAEFNNDRRQIASDIANVENSKRAWARAFVLRPEFLRKYSTSARSDQFVNVLLASIQSQSEVDLSSERSSLAALYDGTSAGRAEIIQRVADNALFTAREHSRALVLMQYFSYLRREPDERSYNVSLNILNSRIAVDPNPYRAMVCTFITSAEYQSRFGMFVTRTNKECGL
jgi:hypothetical protein